MKTAVWGLLKVLVCTTALWAIVAAFLSAVLSLGWSALAPSFGPALPTPSFGATFGGVSALFALIVAVRFAARSPFVSAERQYREIVWQAIFWPPRG